MYIIIKVNYYYLFCYFIVIYYLFPVIHYYCIITIIIVNSVFYNYFNSDCLNEKILLINVNEVVLRLKTLRRVLVIF